MPRVKTTDYYGRYEDTKDLPLKHGDLIDVFWPDKSVTREKLVVQKGHDTEQIDMIGGPDRFRTRKLLVEMHYHGVKISVPLKGLKVEKV